VVASSAGTARPAWPAAVGDVAYRVGGVYGFFAVQEAFRRWVVTALAGRLRAIIGELLDPHRVIRRTVDRFSLPVGVNRVSDAVADGKLHAARRAAA
jgi:hypothetical protein